MRDRARRAHQLPTAWHLPRARCTVACASRGTETRVARGHNGFQAGRRWMPTGAIHCPCKASRVSATRRTFPIGSGTLPRGPRPRSDQDGRPRMAPVENPSGPCACAGVFFWTGMPFLHEGQQADRSGEGLGAPSDNNGGRRGPSMDHQPPVCCGKDFRPDRSCEELGAEAPPTTAGRPRQRALKPSRMGSMECAPVRPCSCPISLRCAARCRGSGCRSARAPTVRCSRRRALRARAVRRARHVRGSGRKGRAAASAA